jgi:hypothetical protein
MWFRGSIAPPARPLSTLRCALAGRQRMTRGQRDWLDLRCRALSSPAPCRFIPTLSPIKHHVTDQPHGRSRTEVSPGARAHTHDHQSPRPSATNLTRSHLTPNRWTSKRKWRSAAQHRHAVCAGHQRRARIWANPIVRHGADRARPGRPLCRQRSRELGGAVSAKADVRRRDGGRPPVGELESALERRSTRPRTIA